ncbi:hypothetical protein CKQ54_22765 [Rahnella variigena]|uniref:Uncharacterized protein n=1 Tax=Rahnella variigena TaxID=574964 RepID=A0ABX9PQM6_9GAMM|nr:hypothetical protein D6D38_10910 [Rahnella variigena]RKF66229.1 hypothetical protein CKQ54_22765 [Rahnella variigena]
MKWIIINSCSCKNTGTVFSLIVTERNNRLILWSDNNVQIKRGDILKYGLSSIYLNNDRVSLHILKIMPYNTQLWQTILRSTGTTLP